MKIHAPYYSGHKPNPNFSRARAACGRVILASYVREDVPTDCLRCRAAVAVAVQQVCTFTSDERDTLASALAVYEAHVKRGRSNADKALRVQSLPVIESLRDKLGVN